MSEPAASLEDRVKELESDLGRVALLTRALIDACLKKGLVTQVELAELMRKADASDGTEDGRLDLRSLRFRSGS
jgi:hypothetical protein